MGALGAAKYLGGNGMKVRGLRVLKKFRSMLLSFFSLSNIIYLRIIARRLLRNSSNSLIMEMDISFE